MSSSPLQSSLSTSLCEYNTPDSIRQDTSISGFSPQPGIFGPLHDRNKKISRPKSFSEFLESRFEVNELDPADDLRVSIDEYFMVDDGGSFEDHYFRISVAFAGFEYTVDRNYVEFVEFIRRLRKVYPQFEAISQGRVSLEHFYVIEKQIVEHHSSTNWNHPSKSKILNESSRASVVTRQDSIMASARASMAIQSAGDTSSKSFPLPNREKMVKLMKGQLMGLEALLKFLLEQPEVLQSEELLVFLDEEVRPRALSFLSLSIWHVDTPGEFLSPTRRTPGDSE
jgi:hypothetical protein